MQSLQFQWNEISPNVSKSMKSNQKWKCHISNKKMFLYFLYKENKMQGMNKKFTSRPYCKKNRQAKKDTKKKTLKPMYKDNEWKIL
jgi:hypothetical protein